MDSKMPEISGGHPQPGSNKERAPKKKKKNSIGRSVFKFYATRFLVEVLVLLAIFWLLVAGYFFAIS